MRRAIDLVGAAAGLVLAAPILGVVAALLRLRLGPPVLFRELRLGEGGQEFELIKLRTMTNARDPQGELLPDADRLVPIGRWVRSMSLDEVPELVMVLRGQMSLVGPRPLPVRYRTRFTAEQARRLDVKPGITGWAQVNGRNTSSWETRLAMDVWYVDHRSLLLDLRILLRTVLVVLRREGINAEGEATMSELPPRPLGSDS
ncbi:MAG: sugar transferase [Acidimicrobiales bacterium]|nr:sugar transferase [Acidimicrobiales bacterium]